MIKPTRWFVPSWCGDIRLEAHPTLEATDVLVTDPTPDEVKRLTAFLAYARTAGWLDDDLDSFHSKGESKLRINRGIVQVGHVLLPEMAPPDRATLTVVGYAGGEITYTTDGVTLPETAVALAVEATTPAPEPEAAPAPEAAAVTVRRPTLCCPEAVEKSPDDRAEEVLEWFMDDEQAACWSKNRYLVCYGEQTGLPYRIVHRDSKLAQRQGKITCDLTSGLILHCYDWSVPPAEEVLAIKLILERRENWLRNSAGLLHDKLLRNPDPMKVQDGTRETAFLTVLGEVGLAFTGRAPDRLRGMLRAAGAGGLAAQRASQEGRTFTVADAVKLGQQVVLADSD